MAQTHVTSLISKSHSSSSAIFERDIEPIVPPSPPNSSNPHRIPRAKTTEQLELSVPSVLDSAATILSGIQDPESISVVTPASASSGFGDPYGGRSSGFASPIGSFRSRSPSPLGLRLGSGPFGHAGQRADLLLSIPQPNQQQQPHSISVIATTTPPLSGSPQSHVSGIPAGGLPVRPSVQTLFVSEPEYQDRLHVESTPPSIVTPTSTYFTTTSSVDGDSDSPTATSHDDHQYETRRQHVGTTGAAPVPVATTTAPSAGAATATSPLISPLSTSSPSHPPSPSHGANKRLSFMSYSDLLTSTPASTLPLSMLTTSASSIDPPPHLPSLSGHHYHHHGGHQHPTTASATGSLRGFPIGPNGGGKHSGGAGSGGAAAARQDSLSVFDDVGGEWEREGFGKGLEERLEASIMPAGSPTMMATQRA